MFASRALLVSVCLALVAISCASSVDSLLESPSLFAADAAWPSPADLPAPAAESQLMNEISARHREFLFANEATGATGGVSSSSSSTGASGTSDKVFGKATVTFLFAISFDNLPAGAHDAILQAIYKASGFKRAIEFLQVVLSPVGTSRRRRLLAVGDTQAVATFTPENENDDSAFAASGLLYRQLTECTQADTTQRAACQNNIAPGSSLIDALPADLAAVIRVGADRTTGESPRGETVASEGTARDTNAGYYVLGAVLACFIIGALVYFIVHKAPVVKETPDAVERREQGVAMEELRSTSAVPADAGAPAAGAGDDAGSMDYKSVFALKHNVLDKKDGAGPAEPADDNDVHFVLHQ